MKIQQIIRSEQVKLTLMHINLLGTAVKTAVNDQSLLKRLRSGSIIWRPFQLASQPIGRTHIL